MGTPGIPLNIEKETLISLLKKHRGRIKHCANELGCQRHTFLKYVEDYADVIELMNNLRNGYDEMVLNLAEENVIAFLEEGHYQMTTYVLDRKGHKRNWQPTPDEKAEELNQVVALRKQNREQLVELQAYRDALQSSTKPHQEVPDKSVSNDPKQS